MQEREVKMWRLKNPKAITLVKLTLWAGLAVWMVFLLAYGVVAAQRLGLAGPQLFGTSTLGQVLTWVVPIWVVFTTLMLIWAVARFANRKLGRKND